MKLGKALMYITASVNDGVKAFRPQSLEFRWCGEEKLYPNGVW
jgi:hypothetical protein